jgi:hypothetical protein
MPPYPVSISVKTYRGSDQRKREAHFEEVRVAKQLERYLNGKMENASNKPITLMYGNIAVDLGIPAEAIAKLLGGIGGHNAIQIWIP